VKVVAVHYRYFVSSGPERYLFSLMPLLEQRGIETVPFSVRYAMNEPSEWAEYFAEPIAGNDELLFEDHTWTAGSVYRSVERAFYSNHVERRLSALLEQTKPDAALVLQYLRKMSPSVLVALKKHKIPIVVRLSDYAMVCPGLQLMRQGEVCEECLGRSVWPSVSHRCVQNSLAVSAVNALATQYHRWRGYFDLIDTFVTPSLLLHDKLVEAGFEERRILHLPTFVTPYAGLEWDKREHRIAYVGRFDQFKGVDVLLRAFAELKASGDSAVRLSLHGNHLTAYGQEMVRLAEALGVRESVTFTGMVNKERIMQTLATSKLSVVPSVSFENMPNSLLESWACSTPVVASDIGTLGRLVEGTGAGCLFKVGDSSDLASTIASLLASSERLRSMSDAAGELAAKQYAPGPHVDALLGVLELAGGREA